MWVSSGGKSDLMIGCKVMGQVNDDLIKVITDDSEEKVNFC